jgi:hypothetical protein
MAIMGVTSSASVIVQSLADMRAKLDDLQRQLGTGQKSDTYAGLGPQRALTVGLQSQLDAANGFDDTIAQVGTRLSLAQDSLTAITNTGQTVRQALAQSNFTLGQNGQTTDQLNAQGQLGTILAALNVQDSTGYIFSGLSPDQPAVQTVDNIMNGVGSQAGFKQVLSERKQADLGTNGMGRLVIPATGAAKIVGAGATLNPDAPATLTGATNISTLLSAGGNLVINGTTIVINPSDNAATVINAINAQSGVTGVSAALSGANHLVLTSANADKAITIGGATSANLFAELGVAAGTTNPMNLLTQGAAIAAQTLTITIGANPPFSVVFGNGAGQVSTLAELQSALLGLSGGAASVDPANGNISVTALNNTDTVTIGGTATLAKFGVTNVPAAPTVGGTSISLSEDAPGSPFGFKIAGANSNMAGTTVVGPTGVPPGISVNVGANPNAGETLTVTFTLPDGSTENVTLTATTSNPPGANQFTIGANAAATAANLQSALTTAVAKLADTSLVAASAVAAANNFFDTDAGHPPQRVSGPPFGTAISLIDGTSANTLSWYTGEAGSSSARSTAVARVDPAVTISFGMRANEAALRTAVKNVVVFAATSYSSSDPNAEGQYTALTTRLAGNLDPPPGTQNISDLAAEIANAQIMAKNAQDRHQQSTKTLTDFLQNIENVSPEQVGTELLALQTSLQASLQTTAMLSKLNLVNFLPIG